MQYLFILFFILPGLSTCYGQEGFIETRLTTAEKFMTCLRNNTPDKVLDFTYHEVDDKISNRESRDFYVSKAWKFIKKFGLPSKEKWIIHYDPKNNFDRLLITIPVFKGSDTTFNLLQLDIILVFPPPQISDKICRYEIRDKYDFTKLQPLAAPKPVEPRQKHN